MSNSHDLKIALVVDWLTVYGGAERVVEQIIECFPNCEIFSLIDFLNEKQRFFIKGKKAKTTFIQKLPFAKKIYRMYLPFMPVAIETINLQNYDLIISSSHAVARGVITYPHQLHITYLQARGLKYLYEEKSNYNQGNVLGLIKEWMSHKIRIWDSIASKRADYTIANSNFVSNWNKKMHSIASEVIYPPVDIKLFSSYFTNEKKEYYVIVGRIEPYKRFDIAINAFNTLNKKLIVIGSGTCESELKKVSNPNIIFKGFLEKEKIAEIISKAKAFVFPGREDFGISLVEAQACGTPVIAAARGGALEVVNNLKTSSNNATGILFKDQTVNSLIEAIKLFESRNLEISSQDCLINAKRFSIEKFKERFSQFVKQKIEQKYNNI